jgi:bifunctional N-acetylglucosamine-1-phosphate-uridyltransferase/glucosamine-1-phosphate-acetyltransferase GlmU-like protein
MTRLLIIPAAGRGTRLGWDGPKVLCPVGGRPMIDYLLSRYRPFVDRVVIVVAPAAASPVRSHLEATREEARCVVQPDPTGMLPAILCARSEVETHRPQQVWITWCDQIAIGAETVARLAAETGRDPAPALVFPTVRQDPPYIHFVRDDDGRIMRVQQRREGDVMPPVGESDAGLFALSLGTYLNGLTEYDRRATGGGGVTQERNFLPFIPWLASRDAVRTFDVPDAREALGVNTPDDLRLMEAYLRQGGLTLVDRRAP